MLSPEGESPSLSNDTAIEGAIPFDPLQPTIFHEPWWLTAASEGRADVVEVRDGNRIVGRLPYNVRTRLGLRIFNLPALTHYLGPAVDEGPGNEPNRFLKRQAVTRDLIAALPSFASFHQKFHKGVGEVLAFQAEEYKATVQFTFEINPRGEETIWRNMRDKTRNVIRTGEKRYEVSTALDPDEFVNFSLANLEARGKNPDVAFGPFASVMSECLFRRRGEFLAARDEKGGLKAAIFCVWDSSAYYYLLSSRAVDSGNNAIPMLIWAGIKRANAKRLMFDFDGVASDGSILLYAGFGGVVSPRYVVSKSSSLYRAQRTIRLKGEAANRFY